MTPSATVADSSDSMAPRMAMVNAGDTRLFIVSHVIGGTCASGSSLLIENLSPMVSIDVTPAKFFSSSAATVITIMAISEPGIFLLKRGVTAISSTLATPMMALHMSMVLMLAA